MSMSDALELEWAQHYFENAAIANVGNAAGLPASGVAGNLFVNLYSDNPGETGVGTLITYTGYVEPTVPRNSGGSGWQGSTAAGRTQMTNEADILFGEKTAGADVTALYWGVHRATASTNPDFYGPVATLDSRVFTTVDSATADTLVSDNNPLVDTDRVMITDVEGEVLPAGLDEDTAYFVVNRTADTFQLSLTSGGAAVALTADGGGRYSKIVPQTIADATEPIIKAGNLQIVFD